VAPAAEFPQPNELGFLGVLDVDGRMFCDRVRAQEEACGTAERGDEPMAASGPGAYASLRGPASTPRGICPTAQVGYRYPLHPRSKGS